MRESRKNLSGYYLSFRLAHMAFGINTSSIQEIVGMGNVKWISPGTTTRRKMFLFRGSELSALHLGDAFGLQTYGLTAGASVIIVHPDHVPSSLQMGIFADDVMNVVRIKADQIVPSPAAYRRLTRNMLLGVGMTGNRTITLLDIDSICRSVLSTKAGIKSARPGNARRATRSKKAGRR
jgi:chemotaxis signal transduction protein